MLARWAGWGALPQLFDDHSGEWADLRDELARLLDPEELRAARSSTVNAHYTAAEVVTAVWSLVADLGFDGGRVLEPGCGSGNFLGLAPPSARLVGVELEPITARIAKTLYPHAEVRAEGFETSQLPPASFDLVVGNVPFGNYRLHDPVHNRGRHSIHNHFLIKAVDLVRPGGLVAVLTSRYTLDAQRPSARQELAGRADLLGAVRLPSNAFLASSGTAAVTDLLVLRRRAPDEPPLDTSWEHAIAVEVDGGRAHVNEWFVDHPDLVLGAARIGSGLYGRSELVVDPGPRPLAEALADATATVVERARRTGRTHVPARANAPTPARPVDPGRASAPPVRDLEEGSFLVDRGGQVWQVLAGSAAPVTVRPARDLPELRALVELRTASVELLDLQVSGPVDDDRLAVAQQRLHRCYDRYAAHHGPLNRYTLVAHGTDPDTGAPRLRRRYPTMGGFRADPHFHTVMALEVFDPDTQTAQKAAVFDQRVIAHRIPAGSADTPQDALALCLDECGRVDLGRIAALLGVPADQAGQELGDLAYADPETGAWATAERYLAGNVRRKLQTARDAAAADPRWERNVTALQAVQPRDLTPGEIDGRLGAAWIPRSDVARFAAETLGSDHITIEHAPITATWTASASYLERYSVLMTSTWGTQRMDAVALLEASLNQKPATVYDPLPETDRRVVNQHETMLAREQQDKLGRRFADWLWEDPDRAERLARDYNERFNSDVLARYDGRHLTFPGLAASWTMRPHQADAVWRVLSDGTALLGHAVGAGKTATMVAAGMELRRLGLAAKPCYAVPNHMLDQFTREFLQLYPAARVLVASEDDATKAGRKAFVGRCATGRWDAVVMTHSAFGRLPVATATLTGYLAERLDDYRAARDEQQVAGGRRTVKQLEGEIKRLEAKHQALLAAERKDDGATFEQTGIDYLFVDEAHLFKNLAFATRIPGVGGQGSQRAEDLAVKLRWLRDHHGGQAATFATATPIANSVAEMFVMQSYLQPDALAQRGIVQFDAWAATFGTTVTALELAPDGGSYRMNTRFARFRNVPELVSAFAQVADVQTPETLVLPRPAVAGGAPQTVVVPASPDLRDYVQTLVDRAERVRNRAVEPAVDNMLKVTGDGRKAALDLRLVGRAPDPEGGKVAAVAERVAALYHANAYRQYLEADGTASRRPGALQLVFCDLSTPKPGAWSVYDAVRDHLVAHGLPADQVRYVHEAGTDATKAALFADCRDGRVAVLLGSTEKMGVGTNVQRRLLALHHLDAPWRPSDIEQREGRILRQGNQNPEVHVLRYVTEGSFDVYMWQTLERKAGFIGQVLSGRVEAREVEEVSEASLSFAEVKALATGNPLILEKADVDAQVARLSRLRSAHERDRARLVATEREQRTRAAVLAARAGRLDATAAGRTDTRGDRFAIELDGRVLRDRGDAGQALRDQLATALVQADEYDREITVALGRLSGYSLRMEVREPRARALVLRDDAEVVIDAPEPLRIGYRRDDLPRDPRQLVQRLERTLQGVEAAADTTRERATTAHEEAERALQRHQTPFPDQSRLARLRDRQREIEQHLAPEPEQPPDTSAATTLSERDAGPAPIAPRTWPAPELGAGPEL